MKKADVLCRILCYVLAAMLIAVPVSATTTDSTDMSVTQGCHSIDAQVSMLGDTEEITNMYSAFLYDYGNDTLIYSLHPDQKHDPASLVKIMTGLIIAEKANLDDVITVDGSILEALPANSLSINLQAGEMISMRDLLYCILVESANDAALIAADHVCGSVEAFVEEMNRYAAELGCKDTVFTNVHGTFDKFQVSTARDLARILTKAAQNETFMEVFGTVNYTVPATNLSDIRELSSNNFLMNDDRSTVYLDSRVTGGRAGTMDTGERNLAVTAEKDGVKLVSVVLGSLSEISGNGRIVTFGSFNETKALLDMGFKGHKSVQLFYEGQVMKQFEVVNGDNFVSTGVKDAVLALLPSGVNYEDLTYRYSTGAASIYAPVKAGDLITSVQVWYNDICLAQTNLYALHDVKVKESVSEEELPLDQSSGASKILVVVAVIVVLLFVLLFSRRMIFRMIHKHRIRRHRKNRRRSR